MNEVPGCFNGIFDGFECIKSSLAKCFDPTWWGRNVEDLTDDEEYSLGERVPFIQTTGNEMTDSEEDEAIPLDRTATILAASSLSSIPTVQAALRNTDPATSGISFSTASTSRVSTSADNVIDDADYGVCTLAPFSPTWLADYPQIAEHLHSEHLLHVKGLDKKGQGLTWHTEKFATDMNPKLNPEATVSGALHGGFQMKMGYFIIPKEKMDTIQAPSLSEAVAGELMSDEGYRFFVHPEAYNHFRSLHQDKSIRWVTPEESEFIATPTSSYRSLAIRRVAKGDRGEHQPAKGSTPFIVKVGVGGAVLGSDRWLSISEVERSVQSQIAFDGMKRKKFNGESRGGHPGSELLVFPESLGLSLKNVEHYPPLGEDQKPVKASGVIIREFPQELLKGNCRIVSMAALMSTEKTKGKNALITQMAQGEEEIARLPLIYQIMQATIKAGKAENSADFVEKYLIKGYIDAIEAVTFQEGMTLEPHSQNLCIVLNNDLTPRGFAYRDHGGIWIDIATRGLQGKHMEPFHREKGDGNSLFKTKGAISKGYIGSFSWFYRYQVFVKMLNVITKLTKDQGGLMPDYPGAPYQIGSKEKMKERNINTYVKERLTSKKVHGKALAVLSQLSISPEQGQSLLKGLDQYYFEKMDTYFDMQKVDVELEEGALPASEGGSGFEAQMLKHKGFLGKYRFNNIPSDAIKLSMEQLTHRMRDHLFASAITSFEGKTIAELEPASCIVMEKGVCFLNASHEIIAFSPYSTPAEGKWVSKSIFQ